MSGKLHSITHNNGVEKLRRGAGAFVAPQFRDHLSALNDSVLEHNHRLQQLEEAVEAHGPQLASIEQHMPEVLNAIASTHGAARLLRREFEDLRARVSELDGHRARVDTHIQEELWPLMQRVATVETLAESIPWLLTRVETIRAEMMHELRYGRAVGDDAAPQVEIVNEAAVAEAGGEIRLNLGCGHIPLEGYVNVDIRKLPGVDVVAPVDELPFEPGSIAEISSAHTLEHFPQAELERTLLPYWFTMLRPGGVFRAIVPDLAAMIEGYTRGEITFENLRLVAYGGQEYEGDFHFTAFTPESLGSMLEAAGFEKVETLASGRRNGDSLEFELVARRPD